MKRPQKNNELKKPVWDEVQCKCYAYVWQSGWCDYCAEFQTKLDQYGEELDAKANGGCDW